MLEQVAIRSYKSLVNVWVALGLLVVQFGPN